MPPSSGMWSGDCLVAAHQAFVLLLQLGQLARRRRVINEVVQLQRIGCQVVKLGLVAVRAAVAVRVVDVFPVAVRTPRTFGV